MKTTLLLASVASVLTAGSACSAQTRASDPTQAYIAAGFAAMDFDRNGQVSEAEFGRFMRARLDAQSRKLDAAFVRLDKNSDGKISRAEAAPVGDLAANFNLVDANHDNGIDKSELRAAAAQAAAQETVQR